MAINIMKNCIKVMKNAGRNGKSLVRRISHGEIFPSKGLWQEEYEEKVFQQKHPYQQWIRENEISVKRSDEKGSDDKESFGKEPYIKLWQPSREIKLLFEEELQNAMADDETWKKLWQKLLEDSTWLVLVLATKTGEFSSDFEGRLRAYLEKGSLWYSDEDYLWRDSADQRDYRLLPYYKPDWSPETLENQSYFGGFFAMKRSLVEKMVFSGALDLLNQDTPRTCRHKIALLATELLKDQWDGILVSDQTAVCHIPEILFHRRVTFELPKAENRNLDRLQRAESYLQGELENGHLEDDFCQMDGERSLLQDENCPKISVVVLSKDHPEVLETCLESFRRITDYPSYELLVVDNGSSQENRPRYEEMAVEYDYKYFYQPMEFNFSAQCNLGVREATGELILLLNDDVEILEKNWLREMATLAVKEHVGAVGAKLLYANTNKLQHVGVTNMNIGPSHKLVTYTDDKYYYHGRNEGVWNSLAVTAACLLVKRSAYENVGGLDENLRVAYNDVDFCFKLAEAGFRNVQCNYAELFHYESFTRGLDEDSDEKWNRLLEEKEKLYARHPGFDGVDPYYSKHLIQNAPEYFCGYEYPWQNHMALSSSCKLDGEPLSKGKSDVRLTVDHAMHQRKIHKFETEVVWIDGWVYMSGEDNAKFRKRILLKKLSDFSQEIYAFDGYERFRPDAEAILPLEKNISMAGFSLRFDREKLPMGTYQVGVEITNLAKQTTQVVWSDRNFIND